MVAAAQAVSPEIRAPLLAAFGIMGAFAVFSDAGASTYLLTRQLISRYTLFKALLVQAAVGLSGAALAVGYCVAALPWRSITEASWMVGCLALASAADSATRVSRSVNLQRGNDLQYALGDASLAVGKLAVAVGLMLTALAWLIVLLPAVSLVVLIVVTTRSLQACELCARGTQTEVRTLDILRYGAAGAVSGLYSQAPFLVAAYMAPVEAVAALAVVLRTIQPLEIVPAVLSQQVIPRVRKQRLRAPRYWATLAGVGAAGALVAVALRPLIELVFAQPIDPPIVLGIVAATLPFKFGNYLLSAFLLATGGIAEKIIISASVGVAVLAASIGTIPSGGAIAAAVTMISGEVLLAICLSVAIARVRRCTKDPS